MNRSCLQIGLSVAMLTLAVRGIAGVTLTTMSFQDSLRPILPGWGRHFWNQRSVVYQHPPAFDFTNVALGDACTRAQCDCGCIPSEWMGEIDKSIAHTTWINCQIATAEALEELAKCCATASVSD